MVSHSGDRSRPGAAEHVAGAPEEHRDLRLTPSVGAFQCLVTSVGIWSRIESSWERSSAPSR